MTDTKQTPTPLEAVGDLILLGDICIAQTMQEKVGRGAAIYNAAHIVKCVNMHEELVANLNYIYTQWPDTSAGKHARATLKKAGAL